MSANEPANDNRKRQYQRDYMARRRHGGKTLKSLLREGLALIAARAGDDPEAQTFIAAVREVLDERKAGAK